jgi:hypothetical protein
MIAARNHFGESGNSAVVAINENDENRGYDGHIE